MDIKNDPFAPMPRFSIGRKEFITGGLLLLFVLGLTNCVLFGGLHFGFAFLGAACVTTAFFYLLASNRRPTVYTGSLFALSLVILLGFARSDDGFVKFVMVCFLFVSVGLCLCLTAGQNRRLPSGIFSIADAFRCFFVMSFGSLTPCFSGLSHSVKNGSPAGRRGLDLVVGLLLTVPVLGIVIPLLIGADAAFEGLVELLPEFDFSELLATLILGGFAACLLFAMTTGLVHRPKQTPAAASNKSGLRVFTVNTVLGAVSLVYVAYLFSQLAYFAGGFSGILPEGYTLSQYARRGFFEMACLCGVNLGIMILAAGLVEKKDRPPLSTRVLCLFIGMVTLFLVAAASGKMALYIGSYGLTRLRVLTQVIIVFLGLTTTIISLWLFLPKLPYMKVVLLTGLLIGGLVLWADVDTVVARYNVRAYQAGVLEEVDTEHLFSLGEGAIPYIAELAEDDDPVLATDVGQHLARRRQKKLDFRTWNYSTAAARRYLTDGSEGAD